MLKTSRKMINHLCGFWVDNIWQLSSLQIMLGGTFESFECGGCHPQIGTKIFRFIWGNYYIDSWLKSWFLVNPQNRPGFIHLKLTPFSFFLQIKHGFMSDWMVARRPQKFQWESTRNACFLPEMDGKTQPGRRSCLPTAMLTAIEPGHFHSNHLSG